MSKRRINLKINKNPSTQKREIFFKKKFQKSFKKVKVKGDVHKSRGWKNY